MSCIDDLIAKHCPNGVEHQELGELASYSDTRISASSVDEESFVGVDNLLPNQAGRTASTYVPTAGNLTEYRPGDILIGNIRPYLKKIWLATNTGGCNGDVLALRIAEVCRSKLTPNFLYRILSSDAFFAFNMQHAKGAKMPRGSKAMILKYRVPTPPVEVQQEIVKVLDVFTKIELELTAELQSELAARKLQYKYYHDKLLTFKDGLASASEGWTTLSEVGTFVRGRRFTNKDFVESGVGCIHYGEIYTHYGLCASETKSFLRPELAATLRMAKNGDLVIAGTGESVEDIGKAVAWLGDDGVAVHDDCYIFTHSLNPKYMAYFFQTSDFNEQKVKFAAGAKMIRVSSEGLGKIRIYVPPFEEQERVVSILDKLAALVNELSSCLPVEIQARRQQYEYYRNRLLTFREAL